MEYRITIEKVEPNPNYEPKRSMYGVEPSEPRLIDHPALSFTATEAQFAEIRKAALQVF